MCISDLAGWSDEGGQTASLPRRDLTRGQPSSLLCWCGFSCALGELDEGARSLEPIVRLRFYMLMYDWQPVRGAKRSKNTYVRNFQISQRAVLRKGLKRGHVIKLPVSIGTLVPDFRFHSSIPGLTASRATPP